jgi:hypothetical protein
MMLDLDGRLYPRCLEFFVYVANWISGGQREVVIWCTIWTLKEIYTRGYCDEVD